MSPFQNLRSKGRHVALSWLQCCLFFVRHANITYVIRFPLRARVGLVDMPHITALAFLPQRTTGRVSLPQSGLAGAAPAQGVASPTGPPLPLKVLAGTAKHKLWLYDLAVGKRPQMELSWGETKITALVPEPSGGPFPLSLEYTSLFEQHTADLYIYIRASAVWVNAAPPTVANTTTTSSSPPPSGIPRHYVPRLFPLSQGCVCGCPTAWA